LILHNNNDNNNNNKNKNHNKIKGNNDKKAIKTKPTTTTITTTNKQTNKNVTATTLRDLRVVQGCKTLKFKIFLSFERELHLILQIHSGNLLKNTNCLVQSWLVQRLSTKGDY